MNAGAVLEPYGILFQPSAERRGVPYRVYPARGRPRWLLPAVSRGSKIAAGFTSAGGFRSLARDALVASGMLRAARVWLDVTPLGDALADVLGAPVESLAFYVGTDGAYQKLTARVTTRASGVSAYAKIAAHDLARGALERERAMLGRLGQIPALRGAVPEVLGWLRCGELRLLVLSAGPRRRGPRVLTGQHLEFLRRLGDATRRLLPFRESLMWARIVAAAARLLPRLVPPWPDRYARALHRLERQLGPVVLPHGVAHRDFAPWNTGVDHDVLFVFDWEAAADGTTPLYDVFHFNEIQAAQTGGRAGLPPSARMAAAALGLPSDTPLGALYAAYLVDASLFYAEARVLAPHAGEDDVWRWLGGRIDAWLGGSHGVA
ncbi:MAG TPA: phosphotransferase [bacterium]|nr:phosphotransferase [bacterium]